MGKTTHRVQKWCGKGKPAIIARPLPLVHSALRQSTQGLARPKALQRYEPGKPGDTLVRLLQIRMAGRHALHLDAPNRTASHDISLAQALI
ncbi:hypothetical protein KYG_06004 [Acidovorax sp. NO-1]|nr:hypothetical protein KYG_06004 [Acidovorax sp. NO-1]